MRRREFIAGLVAVGSSGSLCYLLLCDVPPYYL
jgi:hypothetical protein